MRIILLILLAFGTGYFLKFSGAESNPATTPAQTKPAEERPPLGAMAAHAAEGKAGTQITSKPPSALESLPPAKRRMLEELTQEDISLWTSLQKEKENQFLKNESEYWRVGKLDDTFALPERFDPAVLYEALGQYSGQMTYEVRELNSHQTFTLSLLLMDPEKSGTSRLAMKSPKDSMNAEFSYEYIGTDGQEIQLVWSNSITPELPFVSTYAIRFRSGMKVGEKVTVPVMGLDKNFQWKAIGSIELAKVSSGNP